MTDVATVEAPFAFGDPVLPGLAKLAEEIGEAQEAISLVLMSRHLGRLGQVVGKLMMTHGDPAHWSGNLREMLLDEIADVEASIVFFNRHNMVPDERRAMARRVTAKVNKFELWHADMAADPPPPLAVRKHLESGDG